MPARDPLASGYRPRARRPIVWLEWLAIVLLLTVALGIVMVPPIVRAARHTLSAALSSMMYRAAFVVHVPCNMACDRVQESGLVKAMVGEPIVCDPLERVEFLEARQPDTLEFTFSIAGPNAAAEAHGIAVVTSGRIKLARLDVTGPDGQVIELLRPRDRPITHDARGAHLGGAQNSGCGGGTTHRPRKNHPRGIQFPRRDWR